MFSSREHTQSYRFVGQILGDMSEMSVDVSSLRTIGTWRMVAFPAFWSTSALFQTMLFTGDGSRWCHWCPGLVVRQCQDSHPQNHRVWLTIHNIARGFIRIGCPQKVHVQSIVGCCNTKRWQTGPWVRWCPRCVFPLPFLVFSWPSQSYGDLGMWRTHIGEPNKSPMNPL